MAESDSSDADSNIKDSEDLEDLRQLKVAEKMMRVKNAAVVDLRFC